MSKYIAIIKKNTNTTVDFLLREASRLGMDLTTKESGDIKVLAIDTTPEEFCQLKEDSRLRKIEQDLGIEFLDMGLNPGFNLVELTTYLNEWLEGDFARCQSAGWSTCSPSKGTRGMRDQASQYRSKSLGCCTKKLKEFVQNIFLDVDLEKQEPDFYCVSLKVYSSKGDNLLPGTKMILLDDSGNPIPYNDVDDQFIQIEADGNRSWIELPIDCERQDRFSIEISQNGFITREYFAI